MGATKTETKPSFVSVFVFCRILWVCKIRKRNTGSVTYKTELEFRKMSRICKIDLQTYDWSVPLAMFRVCSSPGIAMTSDSSPLHRCFLLFEFVQYQQFSESPQPSS